jgi:hypothetical protein
MVAAGRMFERKVGAMAGPHRQHGTPQPGGGTWLATNMAMQPALRPTGWPPPLGRFPMAISPIAEAAARYRHRRAKILDDADQAAQTIRQDLGLPRDRRQWADHPALYNRLQSEVVMKLEGLREQGVADLRAARAEARRSVFRVQVGPEGGVNRTMALMNYRQAREFAMALPLGEPGFHMAMERMRMAALTGDEQEMAALSLLAAERANGQRGTAWDRIPAIWEQNTANKYTREGLAELREADDHLAQLASPDRYSLPRLTPIAPEPEPAPTLASSNNQAAPE